MYLWLLLSLFSRVKLCATPQMAAHKALPSLGFSRQEHWSGLPFPSPKCTYGKGCNSKKDKPLQVIEHTPMAGGRATFPLVIL